QESSSKRAGDELEQERSKKQKIKDENESTELKRCLEIVPNDGDEVTIDATPLSFKSPTIVDYKIYKERRKSFFQIFIAESGKDVSVVEEVNAASIATSVTATTTTAATTPIIFMDEITLAKALIEIKTSRPKTKQIVMQKPSETSTPTPIVSSQQRSNIQDKGKGIMVEPEMPLKKKAQISLDEEFALKLQAEEDEQERIVKEKAQQIKEVNLAWDDIQVKVDDKGKGIMVEPEMPLKKKAQISLDEEFALKLQAEEDKQERIVKEKAQQIKEVNLAWDDIQVKVDVDYELAQRLQAEEQEKLTDAKKARLVNMFVDMDKEVVESTKKDKAKTIQESSSKRAGDELK
nr:hypothetical protein [Tanacetum cinerariifolium]